MTEAGIAAFAREKLQPIDLGPYGPGFPCAATLVDGLHLPCVMIGSAEARARLARRRLEETAHDKGPFGNEHILRLFVAQQMSVVPWAIRSLEPSRYAIPAERWPEIGGETSMGWIQFTARMRDGREFTFGTTFYSEFFQMPDGYSGSDIVKIIPAPDHAHSPEDVLRERQYFTCWVGGL